MKQLLVSIAIVFASVLTVTGQNHSFSLSGKWNFQIDREDAGMKEQWFNKSLDESINLPGSMPEKLKGTMLLHVPNGQEVYMTVLTISILTWRNTDRRESQITFLPDSRQALCRCRLVSKESDNSIRLERGKNSPLSGTPTY